MATKKLEVILTGTERGVSKMFGDVGKGADSLGSKLANVGRTVGKTLAIGAAGATIAFGAFVADGFTALAEIERINAQTVAAIESTGAAAKVSAAEVESQAAAIEKLTGIEAESIQTGQNLLLTFTNIRNEVGAGNDIFSQATELMTDVSVAMGTDAKTAAMQLGKALNDPVAGMASLGRVGIQFTAQQKEQIKTLTEQGDVLGAQKIILAELERQFGGSAEAFGATTAGKVAKLKNAFGEVQEEIAAKLLPVGIKLLTWAQDALPKAMDELRPIMDRVGSAVGDAADAFGSFADKVRPAFDAVAGFVRSNPGPVLAAVGAVAALAFGAWAVSAGAAAVATIAATWPVLAVVAAVALLAAGITWAYQNVDWFREAVTAAKDYLTDSFIPAIQSLWSWFAENLLPIIQTIARVYITVYATAFRVAATVVTFLAQKVQELWGWFSRNLLPIVRTVASAVAGQLRSAMDGGRIAVAGLSTAARVVSTVLSALAGPARTVASVVGGQLRSAIDGGRIAFNAAKTAAQSLWNVLDRIIGTARDAANAIKDLPSKIPGAGIISKIPGLATGGIAQRGMPHIVGENGPELFVPGMTGTVIPNHVISTPSPSAVGAASSRLGSGGDTYVTVVVEGSVVTERKLVEVVRDGLVDIGRRTGRDPLVRV